jgi:hypothetical protein
MSLDISFQLMPVLIDGYDSEGRLILADGQLTAVIVRLDGQSHDPEQKGQWHLEAAFGKCDVRDAPLFKTPEEAGAWVKQTLKGNRPSVPAPPHSMAGEFRREAQKCRTIAEQVELNDVREELFDTADRLGALAGDEERQSEP